MPFDFGREICGDLATAGSREWLVTNGIGGYAMGTVAGHLSRRYHGLLIAALKPPLGRTLLVSKIEDTARYDGRAYILSTNRWTSGVIDPQGYRYLERFHLEGTTPVWSYACADALLQKRVWMQPGANTTYVRYDLVRGGRPLSLAFRVLVNYRDHHAATRASEWRMNVEPLEGGLRVLAFDGATPFYLFMSPGSRPPAPGRQPAIPRAWGNPQPVPKPQHDWYRDFHLEVEAYRGLDAVEDHLYAGYFEATLEPGHCLTFVASTDPNANRDGTAAYAERQMYEQELLVVGAVREPPLQQLALAADQFIVRRSLPDDPDGRSVIAGYPWFGDWGRDTMIALPGLTLATGRPEVAAKILRTFARFVDQGMLPNRFPDEGETPEYNTVDATLWYFEAIRAYFAATGDKALLRDLFPILQEIIEWHLRGTRYQIRVDPADGLLYAGEPGVQLTWMDAKVDDWVVTPRIGKPVEINALWYNALRIMADFERQLDQRPMTNDQQPGTDTSGEGLGPSSFVLGRSYDSLAQQAQSSFGRFWNEKAGYCYDVIDGPGGHDASLRPNQLFAVSLPYSPLTAEQQRAVVDVCARHLLTSHGLRSLSADDPAYTGRYGGDRHKRDGAYHQGTVWGWLIGPFVSAYLRVTADKEGARGYLEPLLRHLADHGLGSISEIFDGDPPFTPRGCPAQAWSVAEVLRTLRLEIGD